MVFRKSLRNLILSASLIAGCAFGYQFAKDENGNLAKWNKEELVYGVDRKLNQDYKDSLEEALNKWSVATDGKIKFTETQNGKWDIFLSTTPLGTSYRGWVSRLYEDGELAKTIIFLNSDMEFIRRDKHDFKDMDSTILHEAGHALGLGHAKEEDITYPHMEYYDMPTMSEHPSLQLAKTMRDLHLDDIAGIRELYGLDKPHPQTLGLRILDLEKKFNKKGNFYKPGKYEIISSIMENGVIGVDGNSALNNIYTTKLKRGVHIVKAEVNGSLEEIYLQVGKPIKKNLRTGEK